ncbi:hypothetical protein [Sporosarcina sp. 6E9]|nr:hypothetical protein [Sporosarcina sp. 6E9]
MHKKWPKLYLTGICFLKEQEEQSWFQVYYDKKEPFLDETMDL